MREERRNQAHGEAARAIGRRDALQWLALAVAGLPVSDAVAKGGAPGPARFLDAAALRRAIRAAPEEVPGQPGLYSLRLSGGAPGEPVVLGIRRTAPTRSEVHAGFADVWYVLAGAATLVTGGAILGGEETVSGEFRGRGINGGEARRVQPGDFVVVPPRVPHWVSRVGPGELLYFVVKVPARP
jgi:mannose-6-phosphate isomerase-like protein (cupin superfamily)